MLLRAPARYYATARRYYGCCLSRTLLLPLLRRYERHADSAYVYY